MSEKDQHSHITGFWEDLGQRAKKQLDKFEANAPNRREEWKKSIKPLSFLDYLGCLLILIIIVVCYFAFKASIYLFGIKILKALGF